MVASAVRRPAAILLLLCFLGLGSGVLEYLHNLQHEREDAAEAQVARAAGLPQQPHKTHDETNCEFHAQLHVPMLSAGWVPLLVLLGVFVAYLTTLARPLVGQRIPLRIDCRGPPLS
jgi:hypothetical protein